MRRCIECPALVPNSARAGRCPNCNRNREAARGNSNERGYGAQHQKLRASYQRRMARGEVFTCWRCAEQGKPHPVDPNNWDLGHVDGDKTRYRGPECSSGNRATRAH